MRSTLIAIIFAVAASWPGAMVRAQTTYLSPQAPATTGFASKQPPEVAIAHPAIIPHPVAIPHGVAGAALAESAGLENVPGETAKELGLTGDYKALDFWEKVKLGSAYYVNPQAVRNTIIVYSYAPQQFVAADKTHELWSLARDGKVAFGIQETPTHSITAVTFSRLPGNYKAASPADLNSLLSSGKISIISDKESLLGGKATQTLVTQPGGTPIPVMARPDYVAAMRAACGVVSARRPIMRWCRGP